jgi:protein-tyrosine phosphatase/membrane-associated phospholipid phosphatase
MGNVYGVGSQADRQLMFRAAATSSVLSLLFVIVYGATNWFTAQRPAAEVHTWYFAWERTASPYVPLLLVPYMSLDLFFFLATFLCRDERELRTFAQRVACAIGVAGVCFLLLPLKLDWPPRPQVSGWFGDFIEQSCTAPFLMEYPHNLFPSLHIVLSQIVAEVYTRHTRGLSRALLCLWFFLIGISTVLTWQHHVIDIAGGLVLAGFIFYFLPGSTSHRPGTRNVRVGCYYTGGAALLLALASTLGIWGALLLWPVIGLTITGGAYFGFGPGIWRKTHGRLSWSTRLVLAPVLIGQYLSLAYYRRRCRPWDEVVPGVLIGRLLTQAEAAPAIKAGVTAVLDLTAEFSEAGSFVRTHYWNMPILDLTAPTQDQLHEAAAFVAREAASGTVYVHCKVGYSRSAAVVGAFLLAARHASTCEDAAALLVRARPSIVIRAEAMQALRAFAMQCSQGSAKDDPDWICEAAGLEAAVRVEVLTDGDCGAIGPALESQPGWEEGRQFERGVEGCPAWVE